MRLSIDLHFSLGKPVDDEDRYADHTGSHHDTSETTTGLGFTGPGPKLDEAWE